MLTALGRSGWLPAPPGRAGGPDGRADRTDGQDRKEGRSGGRVRNGWLERRDDEQASDLDLAVLLLNSLDALIDPPDRLTDLVWFRAVLAQVGHDDIAAALQPTDLAELRQLRAALRTVFAAKSVEETSPILNELLLRASAVPQLVVSAGRVQLRFAPDSSGLRALQVRLPAALADHVADRGIRRLGTCAALPCQCAFVDHTRARTRRYCCTACNDRAAAPQSWPRPTPPGATGSSSTGWDSPASARPVRHALR
jgi:predicted RNA-binding Zn ribbon-like protein